MFSKTTLTLGILLLFVLAPALVVLPTYAQSNAFASAQKSTTLPLTVTKSVDGWAGWGDYASAGSVTMVTATVVVQAVTCSGSSTAQAVGDFVAIDGYVTDFLYLGPSAWCASGSTGPASYYMVDGVTGGTINGVVVKPGDKITMTITVSGGTVKYRFRDATSKVSGKDTTSSSGDELQAAECVTDMYSPDALAKFSSVSFTNCQAKINGVTHGIGAFGSAATLYEFACVSTSSKILAISSGLSTSTTMANFKVTWKAYGP